MTGPIRVLIVDDEPLAVRKLKRLLLPDPDLQLIAATNAEEAIKIIEQQQPHILLLDIQMPDMDGFDLLRQITFELMPYVIFVTAFDRYAIEAFEVRALDYLLKPFSPQRLEQAMGRAKNAVTHDRRIASHKALLELLDHHTNYLKRIVVKERERVFFVPSSRIDWIEAVGKYAKIHVGKDIHLLRQGLKALEPRLDPRKFVRIHKSTIINIDSIDQLQSWFHGDYRVLMKDGTQLMLSRRYRGRLEESLGGSF